MGRDRLGLLRFDARHFIDSIEGWSKCLLAQADDAETKSAKSALESPVIAERALACKRAVGAMRETHAKIKKLHKKHGTFSDTRESAYGLVDIVEEMMDLCSTLHSQWREAVGHARKAAEMAGEGEK